MLCTNYYWLHCVTTFWTKCCQKGPLTQTLALQGVCEEIFNHGTLEFLNLYTALTIILKYSNFANRLWKMIETAWDWSCYEMLWEFFRWLGKFNCKINVVICSMPYVHTLNKIINATLLFKPPFFMSWIQRSQTFSMYKNIYFSQILFTNLSKSVFVSTSPLPR